MSGIAHNVISIIPKGEKDVKLTLWSQGVPRAGDEIYVKGVFCKVDYVRWMPEDESFDGPLRATIYLDREVPFDDAWQEGTGTWPAP